MAQWHLLFTLALVILFFVQIDIVTSACPHSCSQNGYCSATNVCTCAGDYFGHDCSQRSCPKGKSWGHVTAVDAAHAAETECASRGLCDYTTGKCTCQTGFFGHACESLACPDSCNGRGTCVSLKNLALDAARALDHHNGAPYAYDEVWDNHRIRGCVCDAGYYGHNCLLNSCAWGDDPLTTGQVDETQVISCTTTYAEQTIAFYHDTTPTAGSFIVHFGAEATPPLSVTSTDAELATALNALSTIDQTVTVTKTTSSSSTIWIVSFPPANAHHHAFQISWRVNEIQEFICVADSGSFTMTYAGQQTTADVASSANAAALKTALEALSLLAQVDVSFVESGATSVCALAPGVTTRVTFRKTLDDDTIAGTLLRFSSLALESSVVDQPVHLGSARELSRGRDTCRVVEVQSLVCRATGGTFSLTLASETASSLAYDLSAADLKTALLDAMVTSLVDVRVEYSAGTGACTSDGSNTVSIAFTVMMSAASGMSASGDVDTLTASTDTLTGGGVDVSIAEVTPGVSCLALDASYVSNPEAQFTSTVRSGGGTFDVSYRGKTSLAIAAESTAAQVQSLLMKLPTIDGIDVSFSQTEACATPANDITLTFTQNFGNLPTIAVSGTSNLNLAVSTTVDGTKEHLACSGRGLCDGTKVIGCQCYTGYAASNGRGTVATYEFNRGDCGYANDVISACSGEIACSGHGECAGASTYKCTCASGWTGGDCSERTCPTGKSWFSYPSAANEAHRDSTECSNAGACDRTTGSCTCAAPFTGAACEMMSCDMAVTSCSGHGQCLTLAQAATLVLENEDATAYTYGLDANNAHTWDHDQIQICHCDTGYWGYDCSLEDCPKGDNPNTNTDVDEIQVLQCTATGGSFTLSFRQHTTAAVAYDASPSDVQLALEALESIHSVMVSFSTGTVACATTPGVVMSVTFDSNPGALPPLTSDTSLLTGTNVALDIGTHGTTLSSVTGTKEHVVCSDHGTCDYTTGQCMCDAQWFSSNGRGGQGMKNDCGYHSLSTRMMGMAGGD